MLYLSGEPVFSVGCEICESCYWVSQLISQFPFGLACSETLFVDYYLKSSTIHYLCTEFSDMYRFLIQLPLLVIRIVCFWNSTIKTDVNLCPYTVILKKIRGVNIRWSALQHLDS